MFRRAVAVEFVSMFLFIFIVCVRVCYILAQMLGAVATSAFENGYSPSEFYCALKKHFVIEFLATLQLVACAIAVTDKRQSDVKDFNAAGLTCCHLHLQISFTGCGTNPARSFGPVLIRKGIKNTWACGGIAATIYNTILYPRTPNPRMRRIVLLHGAEDEAENKISMPKSSHWLLLNSQAQSLIQM
uniref:Aquaporin 1a (Colton blood group), tandem duplicate 2 n=1 Tax=Seriola lalandi dorsalis TaxID=1841481 RepID=A0A3B4XNL6_SERLL